jgi:hypothetical protein
MFDAEVVRLRRLRNAALRARAIAKILNAEMVRPNSVFSRSAAVCWRIARTITGRLRAHPHLSYQRGPSSVRAAYDSISAVWLGSIARYHDRSLQSCAAQLGLVMRQLDDARALTRSTDLSDSLGGLQMQIRTLIEELDEAAHWEAGSLDESSRAEARICTGEPREGASGNWPYLAF